MTDSKTWTLTQCGKRRPIDVYKRQKQMSRLIDNVVQDCQAVGIETKTPDELALLKSRWSDAQADKSP